MSQVLMAIKPQYVKQIVSGEKTVEYRKTRIQRNDVDCIVIYASSPVKKVIGEVELLDILEDTVDHIWDKTSQQGGCSKEAFYDYYKDKNKAVAYVLGQVTIYDEPKTLSDYHINYYPQSYVYLRSKSYDG